MTRIARREPKARSDCSFRVFLPGADPLLTNNFVGTGIEQPHELILNRIDISIITESFAIAETRA